MHAWSAAPSPACRTGSRRWSAPIIGKARSEETGEAVAGLASQGARPLNYNHFKAPLMENLVKRALRA